MAKNNDKQFTITLNERQLRLLAYACRVTDRLIKNDEAGKVGSDMWKTMRFVVEKSMDILRKLCWGVEGGQNHGIYFDETADILFDMQKTIEHALWLEEDPDKRSNWTNDAFEHTSPVGGEKNIKVKKI